MGDWCWVILLLWSRGRLRVRVRARGASALADLRSVGAGCRLAHVLVEWIRLLLEGHARGSVPRHGDWLSPKA